MSAYQPGDLILVMSDADNQIHRRVIRCCPLEAWHRSGGCSDDQRRVLGALQQDFLSCLAGGRNELLDPVDGGSHRRAPQERRDEAMARIQYAYACLYGLGVRRRERAWRLLHYVLAEGYGLTAAGRMVRADPRTVSTLLLRSADLLLHHEAYERERWRVAIWAMGA